MNFSLPLTSVLAVALVLSPGAGAATKPSPGRYVISQGNIDQDLDDATPSRSVRGSFRVSRDRRYALDLSITARGTRCVVELPDGGTGWGYPTIRIRIARVPIVKNPHGGRYGFKPKYSTRAAAGYAGGQGQLVPFIFTGSRMNTFTSSTGFLGFIPTVFNVPGTVGRCREIGFKANRG